MFEIDRKNRIRIIKGDTAVFDVSLDNYVFVGGDTVYFTVKTEVDVEDILIQKIITEFEGNSVKITLSSEDTNIPIGSYVYDIQLNIANNTIVDTIIGPMKFEVLGGVTGE